MVKKTGEGGSRLAPLCNWTRLGRFLGAEEEGGVTPQRRRDEAPEPILETHPAGGWKLSEKPAAEPKVSAASCSNSDRKHTHTHTGGSPDQR